MSNFVHCCACLKNGKPNGTACRHCGSEDIFTAAQLVQSEYEDNARRSARAEAYWRFITDEWKRLEKIARRKR